MRSQEAHCSTQWSPVAEHGWRRTLMGKQTPSAKIGLLTEEPQISFLRNRRLLWNAVFERIGFHQPVKVQTDTTFSSTGTTQEALQSGLTQDLLAPKATRQAWLLASLDKKRRKRRQNTRCKGEKRAMLWLITLLSPPSTVHS